jgi:hypothetical protein
MEGIRISNKEYRSREGISSSELKKIMKSPAHYKYYKENPTEDTPALLFGRAAHKYILETYDFYNEFAVAPNCDRRTKEGKEIWAKFVAESEGKDVITQEQFEVIDAMRNVMLATPFVSKLINGEHEISYFWTDEDTGLKCKVRPDSINHKLKVIVDYKTCDNAETEHFMKQAIRLGYDLQASYYLDGVKASLECSCCKDNQEEYYEYCGKLFCKKCLKNFLLKEHKKKYGRKIYKNEEKKDIDECIDNKISNMPTFDGNYVFVFIAQEKKPPYAVNILQADDIFIRSGREVYKAMLQTYKECSESGVWYGYMGAENQINSLGVPKWIENMLGEESEE